MASSPSGWQKGPYRDLREISVTEFPKICSCGKVYLNMDMFMTETRTLGHSSGLIDYGTAKVPQLVLLRNCRCGSSLMVACASRRDLTAAGQARRKKFDALVKKLSRDPAKLKTLKGKLRRLMQAGKKPSGRGKTAV